MFFVNDVIKTIMAQSRFFLIHSVLVHIAAFLALPQYIFSAPLVAPNRIAVCLFEQLYWARHNNYLNQQFKLEVRVSVYRTMETQCLV